MLPIMAMLGAFTGAFRAERSITRPARPPRTPLLTRAGRAAARLLPRWATIRTATLSVAGFGAIDAGLWEWQPIAGLIGAGVSLLILEYLTSPGSG